MQWSSQQCTRNPIWKTAKRNGVFSNGICNSTRYLTFGYPESAENLI